MKQIIITASSCLVVLVGPIDLRSRVTLGPARATLCLCNMQRRAQKPATRDLRFMRVNLYDANKGIEKAEIKMLTSKAQSLIIGQDPQNRSFQFKTTMDRFLCSFLSFRLFSSTEHAGKYEHFMT